jgi:hypothetical protein
VKAWATERNRSGTRVNWRFTVEDARIKHKAAQALSVY